MPHTEKSYFEMNGSSVATYFQIILLLAGTVLASAQAGINESAPGVANRVAAPSAGAGVPSPSPALVSDRNSLAAGTNALPLPTSLSGYIPDDKYKLRVGDRVSLQITED